MYIVLFVLHDPSFTEEILDAWEEAGTSGITILPSTGLARIRDKRGLRDDIPLMPSLEDFIERDEQTNRTLFTVVEDDETVERILKASEQIIGNLSNPNTGIMTVLPVAKVYGFKKDHSK